MKTSLLATTTLALAGAAFLTFTSPAEAGPPTYCKPSYSKSYGSGYSRGYSSSRSYFAKPAYPYHGSSSLRKSYSSPSYSRSYSHRPSYRSYSYRPSYSRGYSSRSYCR